MLVLYKYHTARTKYALKQTPAQTQNLSISVNLRTVTRAMREPWVFTYVQ